MVSVFPREKSQDAASAWEEVLKEYGAINLLDMMAREERA
jgi:hypothetical protein